MGVVGWACVFFKSITPLIKRRKTIARDTDPSFLFQNTSDSLGLDWALNLPFNGDSDAGGS